MHGSGAYRGGILECQRFFQELLVLDGCLLFLGQLLGLAVLKCVLARAAAYLLTADGLGADRGHFSSGDTVILRGIANVAFLNHFN